MVLLSSLYGLRGLCRYLTLDDSFSVISCGSVPIVCGWPNYSVHYCWVAAVPLRFGQFVSNVQLVMSLD